MEKQYLTPTQLHYLAMNIVGKAVEELAWEFLFVNSDVNKNPQFVCISPDKQRHFIIVRAVLYGANPDYFDETFMQKVKKHALEHKANTYWAGVGLTHLDDVLLPLEINQPYQVKFNGLLKIN